MARPKRRLTREERREQLLEAALRAFGRTGYHGTQVEQIITEAGVARGTFYLHFPSKHAIFETLVDRMLTVFQYSAPRGTPEDFRSRASWEAFLRRSYTELFTTMRRYRRLGRLLFEEAEGLDKGFAARLEHSRRQWVRRIQGSLEHLLASGTARPDLEPPLAAELILGMVERLTRRYLFRQGGPPVPHLLDTLVRFELAAVTGP